MSLLKTITSDYPGLSMCMEHLIDFKCTLSYSFLLRVYIFVFRAMSHELFGEQVKGASSTYTQSEGNWTGVQRYAYRF